MFEVNSKQHLDPLLMELKELVLLKKNKSFSYGDVYGIVRYQGKFCVPFVDNLGSRMLEEAHEPVTLFISVLQRCTMTLEKLFGGMG